VKKVGASCAISLKLPAELTGTRFAVAAAIQEVAVVWQNILTIAGLAILGAATTQIFILMARSSREAVRQWKRALKHERRAAEARFQADLLRAKWREVARGR